jgi:FlaA1/EpsC-like NDP-sugar epimerase
MSGTAKNRIYIIGAGLTGTLIADEIQAKGVMGRVVAFLDDDPAKIGTRVHGIPVLGPIESVADLLEATPAGEAIIAIPEATREELKTIYSLLKKASFARIRIVPRISQILEGEAHLIQARDINPEDLLTRKPVRLNLKESLRYLRGKRVLVTGAGGSIGSELSRQLLYGGAERLYLLGHGENSIYEIERELRLLQEEGVGEKIALVPIIGDLQDREFSLHILRRLRAQVVFHAAAYKHVPMLEANPVEAIKNNVFGTYNLMAASRAAEVERVILISTDKAVEPTSIYGASKMLAEEIVLSRNGSSIGLVVRFGNVLGSRGSILPLFRKQILKGGPLTLTDPEATRYFMTVPEAVSLVLKAAGVGQLGELYLLDMGSPVPIKELAEQMIRFYGYEPEEDIKLVYTGLRPGEKLCERLWREGEFPQETEFPKILKTRRQDFINTRLEEILAVLRPVCFLNEACPERYRNRRLLRELLKPHVPTLRVPEDEAPY